MDERAHRSADGGAWPGSSEPQAVSRLLRALGLTEAEASAVDWPAARGSPGSVAGLWDVPSRNANFTGRGEMLERLRERHAAARRR